MSSRRQHKEGSCHGQSGKLKKQLPQQKEHPHQRTHLQPTAYLLQMIPLQELPGCRLPRTAPTEGKSGWGCPYYQMLQNCIIALSSRMSPNMIKMRQANQHTTQTLEYEWKATCSPYMKQFSPDIQTVDALILAACFLNVGWYMCVWGGCNFISKRPLLPQFSFQCCDICGKCCFILHLRQKLKHVKTFLIMHHLGTEVSKRYLSTFIFHATKYFTRVSSRSRNQIYQRSVLNRSFTLWI